jgi:nucleotide-binding universal stress UspA family protein
MAIKRVLLPITTDGWNEPAAEAAFIASRLLQAEVRGLLVQPSPVTYPATGEYVDPDLMRQVMDNTRKDMAEVQKRLGEQFRAIAGRHAPTEHQFAAQEGDAGDLVAHAARLADLSVLGAGDQSGDWQLLLDATLFRSGRPVLVAPRQGVTERQFDRVLIAWKETTEAARAVAAAQPFLMRAEEVHLITIGEGEGDVTSLQEVEQYLQLHYSEVRSEAIPPARRPISDTLFERAEALGGALLVMGAYSHYRWREQVFGGVTETALRKPRTPILMAH